jgi:hypothetical protein
MQVWRTLHCVNSSRIFKLDVTRIIHLSSVGYIVLNLSYPRPSCVLEQTNQDRSDRLAGVSHILNWAYRDNSTSIFVYIEFLHRLPIDHPAPARRGKRYTP